MKTDISREILSNLVVYSKYSKYIPELKRRETWEELVLRNMNMHIAKFPKEEEHIREAYQYVLDKKILPSSRSLQFAGKPIELSPSRLYNCSFVIINKIEAFSEIMFLLLGGSGVSYSVQKSHVAQLPDLVGPKYNKKRRYLIADSIEGWADAIKVLFNAYFEHKSVPEFDYGDIRKKGMLLKTSGGRAPGPQPLKDCIHNIIKILDRAIEERGVNTKLKPIEAHDINCFIADCVLSGGIRRAACLSMFSVDDEEMFTCKYGNWYELNGQRARANNSVTLMRYRLREDKFRTIWNRVHESNTGEPGVILTNDKDMGYNPCFDGATLIAVADGRGAVPIAELAESGLDVPVYSVNPKTGIVSIKMARNPRVTGKDMDLVKVTLDDNTSVTVTPNHKFLLIGGGELEAKDLKPRDSLMRFTKRSEKISKNNEKEYLRVYCNVRDPGDSKIFEHRLIAKFFNNEKWERTYNDSKNNGWIAGGLVVHHKDYNSKNNSPDNLEIMTFEEHSKLHASVDTLGEKNGRYSGLTNDELKSKAIELTMKLGRRFSTDEWQQLANYPTKFSSWRKCNFFKSPSELSLWAALECGYSHANLNTRTQRSYKEALASGYAAKFLGNDVVITKICEECHSEFDVKYTQREVSFCSQVCSSKYMHRRENMSDKTKKFYDSLQDRYTSRQHDTCIKQCSVFNNLKLNLGRDPMKKEWEAECSKLDIPHRIASKNQPAYKNNIKAFFSFKELKETASLINHKVKYIEKLTQKGTVYNLTVDDNHTVGIVTSFNKDTLECNGIFTPQCGEASLQNEGFCNLTTINASDVTTQEEFNNRAMMAARIGTYQASYTNFHYLNDNWKDHAEEDSLLGASITGLAHDDFLKLDLTEASKLAVAENERVADRLGINKAKRVTLTKPEGTSSLVLGCSSGVHAWHSKYYIRRIRLNKEEPLYKYLRRAIPDLIEDDVMKPKTDAVIAIPIKAPDGAITRNEGALDLLERCKHIYKKWILPGHREGSNTHNVSVTVSVKKEEWNDVLDWMWNNRDYYNGITIIPYDNTEYKQMPFEEIDEERYNELIGHVRNIDLTKVAEDEDNTTVQEELACAGGACTIMKV